MNRNDKAIFVCLPCGEQRQYGNVEPENFEQIVKLKCAKCKKLTSHGFLKIERAYREVLPDIKIEYIPSMAARCAGPRIPDVKHAPVWGAGRRVQ